MARVTYDLSEYKDFFDRLNKAANGALEKDAALWLEAIGEEFLGMVEDEIISRKVMNTRLLLHSFTKGDANNFWEVTDGGLTLEVGTHVDYASYVNDGHWTNPKGVQTRFVPGVWHGDEFEYVPGAKTGMVLKQQWIDSQPFFDKVIEAWNRTLWWEYIEKKLQQWIDKYFEG